MKKIILPVTLLCAMGIHAMEIRDIELADTPTLCLAHATDPHNGGISAPVFPCHVITASMLPSLHVPANNACMCPS